MTAVPEETHQELERLREENKQLREMLGKTTPIQKANTEASEFELNLTFEPLPSITVNSSIHDKISLFRTLFKGREDVYAVHWTNERKGTRGYSPACEDPWGSRQSKSKKYLPLTDEVVHAHLAGEKAIGIYPLSQNSTCWFLACDFDKEGWALDATEFLNICKAHDIPAYLERSRSGNGGHVWMFFSWPVSAISARQLGMRLLRETMTVRAEMDLTSYDRFFPNQDFVPRGGFGNLIALPLQKKCRALGNTEFVDSELRPWPDQWAFLSQINRITPSRLEAMLEKIPPVGIGPGTIAKVTPAVRAKHPAPPRIRCTLGATFDLEKSGIPPWMFSQIKHLASLHNPKFYERQKLRLTTFKVPRFIKCYEEDASHIRLPRGTFEEIKQIAKDAGSELSLIDQRVSPKMLALKFLGSLTPSQKNAMRAVLSHDMGVLVAPPGAGKTVMGCFAVAEWNVPALILAHRKPILEQWRSQLMEHLGLSSRQIGQVGGGRNRQCGIVDLGMIQSLKRSEDLEVFFSKYGFIIVDECHHLPAFTFEASIKRAPVRHILGLTATPYRRDGLQGIIAMQCGPIRYRMESTEENLPLKLLIRETSFTYQDGESSFIHDIFRGLVKDEARNTLILGDVHQALLQRRRCLILSHRKEHCQQLADRLTQNGKSPYVLSGTLSKTERSVILQSIQDIPADKELLIIATGQYLGEGFDCPQVDTLFLAFPISFKGKLVQYVGRAMRKHPGKNSIVVYDYVDHQVPVLKKMYSRRLKTYKSMGFEI